MIVDPTHKRTPDHIHIDKAESVFIVVEGKAKDIELPPMILIPTEYITINTNIKTTRGKNISTERAVKGFNIQDCGFGTSVINPKKHSKKSVKPNQHAHQSSFLKSENQSKFLI